MTGRCRACGAPCHREGLGGENSVVGAFGFSSQRIAEIAQSSGISRACRRVKGQRLAARGDRIGERARVTGIVIAQLEAGAQVRGEERLVGAGRGSSRAPSQIHGFADDFGVGGALMLKHQRGAEVRGVPGKSAITLRPGKGRPPQSNGLIQRAGLPCVLIAQYKRRAGIGGARAAQVVVRRVKSGPAQFHGLSQRGALSVRSNSS